ncbi:hypothetical protein IS481_14710 [Caldimonas thermodepolymerans]|uniref:hypothetical protein n=1 Tax=Caldimonas thermodepolymerans TaxID=215580 RepID=UPI0011B0A394|nr:hypothetical protein [Caldimonas thermodepolymerans]QPC30974.1 hypothetical protein IS481_14710 [Caldimonas thermodepolymerans]
MTEHNQAHTAVKTHRGMPGIRVCVFKPGGGKLTTIYVNNVRLADLLEVADGDIGAVTHAARYASLRCTKEAGAPWSHTVMKDARKLLLAARARREAHALAAAAAENNAAWEQALH